MKKLTIALYAMGLPPLAFILTLTGLALYMGHIRGYLLSSGIPGWGEAMFYYEHEQLMYMTGGIWFFSLFLGALLILIYIIVNYRKMDWKPLISTITLNLGAFLMLFTPVFKWFDD